MLKKYKTEIIILLCFYTLSLLLGILFFLNLGTLEGETFTGSLRSLPSMYDFVLYLLFADVIATVAVILSARFGKTETFIAYFKNLYLTARAERAKYLAWSITAAGLIILAYILEVLISGLTLSYFIWQRFLFICAALLSIFFIYIFRGKPEKTFLSLALTVGILFAVTLPISTVSWDEEAHYPWSVRQASVFKVYYTLADRDIRAIPIEDYYNKTTREAQIAAVNENGRIFTHIIDKDFSQLYTTIGHTPSGVGIFLSRCFGLSWTATFIIGRIFNLIAYCIVVYFAVKRLRFGKYIMAVVALIPTAIFVASNYSYDNWLIAWLMLGTSYFLAEMQTPKLKTEKKNLAIMLISFIVGLGPKAVYFPLMFMLFFIGREKFDNPKHCRNYRIILTVSVVLIFASFALPFLISTGDHTDIRGGTDVSAGDQAAWILSNPLGYTEVMFNFALKYLNPANAPEVLTNFAFLGFTHEHLGIMLIFITAVVLTDRNKFDPARSIAPKAAILLCTAASLVLVFTALYVAFTPVAHHTIRGVSPRYLLPYIAPLLLIIRPGNIKTEIDKNLYSCTVFTLSAYFLLSNFWTVCISNYK